MSLPHHDFLTARSGCEKKSYENFSHNFTQIMSKVRCSQSNNDAERQIFLLLFFKSEHHVHRCPTPSTVPSSGATRHRTRLKPSPKASGRQEQPGLLRAPLPRTQTHIFARRLRRPAGRTRCEQPAFPPPLPSGTGAPPLPPPVMVPAPVPARSGRRVRLGKGEAGGPVGAAAHRVAALPAGAAAAG